MSALVLRGISKAFGGATALAGVDLEVASGSFTAVLGPSGCGKSTLLRVVAGFEPPDSGTVTLDGAVVEGAARRVPARLRGIGYVAQEGSLFPHLDVAANVAFGLPRRERRRRSAQARTAELLELVGLDGVLARRLPHELSGGQQQRVALARALAPRPGLVLLDEPFSALDAQLRAGTRAAVAAACAAAGTTAVLVTHDQDEALSLADTVAVLRDGAIAQVGTPGALYATPADAFTATFVGDAVLLPGTVADGVVRTELGRHPVSGCVAGPHVQVVVRPEQLRLGPEDHDERRPGTDGVPAQVERVEFHGHDALVHLRTTSGSTTLRCRAPALDLPGVGDRRRVRLVGPVHCLAPGRG